MRVKTHRPLSGLLLGCVFAFAGIVMSAAAQTTAPNEWTWMSGSSQGNTAGVYGQLGIAAPGNNPGGRWSTISWRDANGNLWLYGAQNGGFDENRVEAYLDDVWEYNTSSQEWAWMAGSNSVPSGSSNGCIICAAPPVFGNYQTPSAGNTPGGGLQPAAEWIDKSGNLWLFGGQENIISGGSSIFEPVNALWEFNVSSHEWAWIGGSSNLNGSAPGAYGTLGEAAPGNTPGGRIGSTSWIDSSDNLWLFGGLGEDSAGNTGYLNDLWMFSPSSNQWTWMGGENTFKGACLTVFGACAAPGVPGTLQSPAAGNVPTGRSAASGWTDTRGNFWLFGGTTSVAYDINGSSGFEGTYINDLWEYSPSTKAWTWMSGNASLTGNAPQYGNSPGVYGTQGIPSATNTPGGRSGSYTWIDSIGNLWLFGGGGFDSTTNTGSLGDLWMFDVSQNQWVWIRGSSTFTAVSTTKVYSYVGVYGTLGTAQASNTPGSRSAGAQWTDQSGNIWLFGGWGTDSVGTWGVLNDIWEFNPATALWTWMGGSSTVPNNGSNSDGQFGMYGDLGVPAATNMPGGRRSPASWTDGNSNFWLFGGYGCSTVYCGDYLNDLWEYSFTAPGVPLPTFNPPGGAYSSAQTVTVSDTAAGSTIYYTTNGTTPTKGSTEYMGPVTVSSSETLQAIAVGSGGASSIVASATYTIGPIATAPMFSPAAGTYTSPQSVTLSDTTPGATIYYTANGSSPTTSSTIYSGAITVSTPETIEAMAVASGYSNSPVVSATYTITVPTCASASNNSQPSNRLSNAKRTAIQKQFDLLPLIFEPNRGQSSSDAKFLAQGRGFNALFRGNETDFLFTSHAASSGLLRVTLLNALRNTAVSGEQQLPGTVNYFAGDKPEKWHTGLPTFERLRYASIYPGTDLIYYGNKGRLEFDFQLSPGAAPSSIQLHFDGARNLRIDGNGDLIVAADGGHIAFEKPIIYQPAGAGRKDLVAGHFRILKRNTVCFDVADYDPARPLIIDPILNYSTYIGPQAYASSIAVDQNGEAYVTGVADLEFATTPGSYQPVGVPSATANDLWPEVGKPFVAKFNSTGTALIYSTFLSGSGIDAANQIAIDANGDAFVVGSTSSTNFPVTSGALQTKNSASQYSGFVTELNSAGSSLLYSSYIGGSTFSSINGIAVDTSGSAYLVGRTVDTNFPTTPGAYRSTSPSKSANASSSAFVAKLNPAGNALAYSTFLGGSGSDIANAIALDSAGEAYVGGDTSSFDFPVTPGAFQGSRQASNQQAGFVAKLNASGSALVYSTYLGGNYFDTLTSLALDRNGNAYTTGSTSSRYFPVTPGAFKPVIGVDYFGDPQQNAFVTELNGAGTSLVYSTFLGGNLSDTEYANIGDQANTIAIDGQGMVYVAGVACTSDFPVTAGAFQSQNQDGENSAGCTGFLTKLNPTPHTTLLYSTFFGGTGNQDGLDFPEEDGVAGLALDSSGNVYLAGSTFSVDFPTTAGVVETAITGIAQEATVAEFNGSEMKSLPAPTVTITSNTGSALIGQPVTFTATVRCAGGATPTGFIGFSYLQAESSDNPDPPNTTGIGFGPWTTVPLDGSGVASFTATSLVALQSPVNAFYLGDANYAPATGTMTQTLTDIPTTTSLTSSANNVPYGTPVVFTATVLDNTGKPAIGFIEFGVGNLIYATVNVDGSGQATWTNGTGGAALAVGTDTVIAGFYPYTGYQPSSGSLAETFTALGITPAPVFNPPAGTYSTAQQVTLGDSNSAASIYYTKNGTTPTTGSTLYTGSIAVSSSETLQAIAVASGDTSSAVASATYTINTAPVATAPMFSPAAGTYTSTQSVTLSDTTPGATIYYTTNETAPTPSSTAYSGAITVSATETIEAIAVANGYSNSAIATASYTINLSPPSFTLSASPSSLIVSSGGQGAVTLTPQNGFNSTVNFACSGLPSGASCAFNPPTLTPSAASATTTLSITGETLALNLGPGPFIPGALIVSSLCLLGWNIRGGVRSVCLIAIAFIALGGIAACGGGNSGGGGGGTTPVTSTIVVTATSGSIQQTATISLTVE